MTSFKILVNRQLTYPKIDSDNNEIEIPLSVQSPIYKDNLKPIYRGNLEKVTPELRDFIEVASVINYADRYCIRKEREKWCRNIEINISLRCPEKFKLIKSDLELCLTILSGDNFLFNVNKIDSNLSYPLRSRKNKRKKEIQKLLDQLTHIVLISGGQDSSIAAYDYLQKGKVPFFVRIDTHDKANPQKLLKQANKEGVNYFYLNQKITKLDATIFKGNSFPKETSQRLRSFYFLSVATTIAATTNIKEVNINENGIMAIHLPLDISRSSSFSTRTAYPPYLYQFSQIVQKWLGIDEFEIRNKWILKTKKEVISSGLENKLEKVICNSTSCAHAAIVQNIAKIHKKKINYIKSDGSDLHCGYCFPCILRRISMSNSGLGDKDVFYVMNPFGEMIVDAETSKFNFLQESKSAILSLIRFSKLFREKNTTELTSEYPQIYECAFALDDINLVNDIVDMYKRFSNEVYQFISQKSPRLLFLYDDEKSKLVDKIINSVATINSMEEILNSFKIGNWNEHFEKELKTAYSLVRYRILIALGNDLINQNQILFFFKQALESILPHKAEDRKRLQLNIQYGREVKKKILRDCSCPPFTRRRIG